MNRSVSLLLLLLSATCVAQTTPASPQPANRLPQSYALHKITTSGSKRFAEADIIQATGLKAGSIVTADDLKQAGDRLGQSSVFAQVSYRFDGETADFTVADAEQFVPASFENFIWFSDADLIQRVHSSVPLFLGNVPLGGNLSDQVSAALDAILKEKGIQGQSVSALQSSPTGQPQAMQFHIDGVNVRIAEVRFPGASPDRIPLLQAATKALLGANYFKSPVAEQVKRATPPVYGKLGFLKAQAGALKTVILKDDPAQPAVALEVPIQEGDAYTFSTVNWTGASGIPVADLTKMINLKPGGPADTTQLAGGIAAAKQAFENKGYMYAQVKTTANLDVEKHTAAFNIIVDEGAVYHMGKLEIENLDPTRTELVRKVWEIHEGDVYVASYVKTYLTKHPVEFATLEGWTSRYTQTIHDDTHVVDVVLKFEKTSPDAK
jgi:outer membrane protein assembly factor BamA